MTPAEALRRAATHTLAASVTEDATRQRTILAKAESLQLWGLIGATSGALCAALALVGVYCFAESVGALLGLIPGLWAGVESDLRTTAAHGFVLALAYALGARWLWRVTCRVIGTMAATIEGADS